MYNLKYNFVIVTRLKRKVFNKQNLINYFNQLIDNVAVENNFKIETEVNDNYVRLTVETNDSKLSPNTIISKIKDSTNASNKNDNVMDHDQSDSSNRPNTKSKGWLGKLMGRK